MGNEHRRVLELCQDIARDKTLARLEESVAQIRWGSGGKHRRPVKDGLIVAVFRHYESRAGKPLLHDHAVVSIKARRPDGKWGNVSAADILDNIVAAGTLYTLTFMEEVSARLGWAWEPREVTPGRRPVMEIAGIDQRLIGWQSTRRQQIADVMPALLADYEERQGRPPGERAGYALDQQAADRTRPPKRKVPRSLSELRDGWRRSAIRAFGARTVYRLAQRARAAAAAVWARVRPVVDVALAAVAGRRQPAHRLHAHRCRGAGSEPSRAGRRERPRRPERAGRRMPRMGRSGAGGGGLEPPLRGPDRQLATAEFQDQAARTRARLRRRRLHAAAGPLRSRLAGVAARAARGADPTVRAGAELHPHHRPGRQAADPAARADRGRRRRPAARPDTLGLALRHRHSLVRQARDVLERLQAARLGDLPPADRRRPADPPEPDHQRHDHLFHPAGQQSPGPDPPGLSPPPPAARPALPRLRLPQCRPDRLVRQGLRHRLGHPGPARHLPPGQGPTRLRHTRLHHRLGSQASRLSGRKDQRHPEQRRPGRRGQDRRRLRRDCIPCPAKEQCTSSRKGRRLSLYPRELTETIHTARAQQQNGTWQRDYALRAGVEGAIRQATHTTGLRRARYAHWLGTVQ
ncbi:MobF family relaxase [Streptomyces sp. NBC_00841]|uniref:MobF family relaxase n=1 Tax=Streptomyces sp. NBC_00841 TaxID=2975847 RepID=UPI003FA376DF